MKRFHHGGRIGDLVFALYTMKQLGGGELIISDYHTPNWNLEIARSLDGLLLEQDYIKDVRYIYYGSLIRRDGHGSKLYSRGITHDLQCAEDDYNPEAFPEWDRQPWPSNCNIVKRYAVHFGVAYPPREPWLTVTGKMPFHADVAMHVPDHRIVRSTDDWSDIYASLVGLNVSVVVLSEWFTALQTAQIINEAKVFLGAVSSCNAIAEALGKPHRLIEVADGCWNVNVLEGQCVNGWVNEQIVDEVHRRVYE